jgi:signal transduction histidine kinase
MPLERAPQRLDGVFEEVLGLHRALADERGIALSSGAVPQTGPLPLDRHRIVQLLSNLVANALKFTPQGGQVTLSAAAESGAVVISIADTGPGIPLHERGHVFDRFWQGAHARDAGVGLGLSIARGIAEAHGGTLPAEDNPGGGALFRLRLPRQA